MLRISSRDLEPVSLGELTNLQSVVDAETDYPLQVELAKKLWKEKLNTNVRKALFGKVRETLADMSVGCVRCAYCEDSLADEIEHILPKSFLPSLTFVWENYLFACGPCNGPKNNRYGIIANGALEEIIRKTNDLVVAPTLGPSALINPRSEDPMKYLELDLGGVTSNGTVLAATFQFVIRDNIQPEDEVRAKFTIEVLGLNREVIRVARQNAFGGFRARLKEYVVEAKSGGADDLLDTLRQDILKAPHITVLSEMMRQNIYLPEIKRLIDEVPHTLYWALTK